MASSALYEFGSEGSVQAMWIFLSEQTELLQEVHASIMQEQGERWSVVIPLSYSVVDTCGSVLALARIGKVRDCFVLARTAFETILNICFICARGDGAAIRAKRHAQQKAYRDLERELVVGENRLGLRWQGLDHFKIDPETRSALEDYTSRKGREITSWTPETAVEQLEVVKERYGGYASDALQFALFSIYRHASEIAHGTLFGALFALGLTRPGGPPDSPARLQAHLCGEMTMLLMMLGLALYSAISILSEEVASLSEIAKRSRELVDRLGSEPWAQGGRAATS